MIINQYDLYYTVIKNRNWKEEEVVDSPHYDASFMPVYEIQINSHNSISGW